MAESQPIILSLVSRVVDATMKISLASLALLFAASEAFQVGPAGRRSTSLNILAGTET